MKLNAYLILGIVIFFGCLLLNFNLLTLFLGITCLIGLLTCINIFIYLHEYSPLKRVNYCKESSVFSCSEVLSIRLFKRFELSDIGIIYFLSQLVYFLYSLFYFSEYHNNQQMWHVFVVPITLTFISSFFSIWYQWRIIKKWCVLCLVLVLTSCLQFGIVAFYYYSIGGILFKSPLQFYLQFGVSIYLAFSWVYIKPLLIKTDEITGLKSVLYSFKTNGKIMEFLLKNERKIITRNWEHELFFGNRNAACQIVAVYKPYCKMCMIAQKEINELIKTYSNQIGVTIRFKLKDYNKSEKRTRSVDYILSASKSFPEENAIEILNDWYKISNLKEFKERWQTTDKDNDTLLLNYFNWTKEFNIEKTPTFFINDNELPQQYTISDIEYYLHYKEIMKANT